MNGLTVVEGFFNFFVMDYTMFNPLLLMTVSPIVKYLGNFRKTSVWHPWQRSKISDFGRFEYGFPVNGKEGEIHYYTSGLVM